MLRYALLLAACTTAGAPISASPDVSCAKAFDALKLLEAHHRHQEKLDIDRLVASGIGSPCSKERLQFEYNASLRLTEMAPIAKVFIQACGGSRSHLAELELYSRDEIIHPLPATRRQNCGVAVLGGPSAVR
jgi:hypothetical protein